MLEILSHLYFKIVIISFLLSFLMGLAGFGCALVLVPILVFLGVPFSVARGAGLFTNFLSTLSSTFHNLKNGLIEFKTAIPVTLAGVISAPIGAYLSHIIPEKILVIILILILLFGALTAYLPAPSYTKKEAPLMFLVFLGAFSGFMSGVLGIGGGIIVSPVLIIAGLNPKKVVTVTAFAIPFYSLAGFLTYWKIGSINWSITLLCAIPALISGYASAYITHRYIKSKQIKKFLGLIFLLLAIKLINKFFNF